MSLYFALERQLARVARTGGWPARHARHRALLETLERWIEHRSDVRLMAGAGLRSPAISAVLLPPSRRAKDVLAALEGRGFLAGGALDPRHGNLIRIGHMGDLEPSHLEGLLVQLEEVLQ
jgi:aspartate aminotransferase-like enzyme